MTIEQKFDLFAISPIEGEEAVKVFDSAEADVTFDHRTLKLTFSKQAGTRTERAIGFLGGGVTPEKTWKSWIVDSVGLYGVTSRCFTIPKKYSKHSFELRRCSDPAWKTREQHRIENDYTPLPPEWAALTLPADDFCHVAVGDSEAIAFTENEDKGRRDIQTRMRAGKYLKRTFPEMSNDDIRTYAAAVQTLQGLHFTDDPTVAARIYEHGPSSCMRASKWGFKRGTDAPSPFPRHPVAAYFAGDLQLAWLGSTMHAEARAIVWPEKKLYGRLYGNADRLKVALEREGYTAGFKRFGGTFAGARLCVIRYNSHKIIMPYLDGVASLTYCSKSNVLRIANHAAGLTGNYENTDDLHILFNTQTQSGLLELYDSTGRICAISGRELPEDEIVMLEASGYISSAKTATEAGYHKTVQGRYSYNPVIIIDKDENTTVNWAAHAVPEDFVQDRLEAGKVYRPRECCTQYDRGKYSLLESIKKANFVYYEDKYYSNLSSYYDLTKDTRRILSAGPFSQADYHRALADMIPFCTGRGYTSVEEFYEKENRYYYSVLSQQCAKHDTEIPLTVMLTGA